MSNKIIAQINNTKRRDVPDDWNVVSLGELCLKIMKGIFDLNPVNYVEKGIPFLRISDIKNARIEISTTKFISNELRMLGHRASLCIIF